MKRNILIASLMALLASVYFNISLSIENEMKNIDIRLAKESADTYAAQRNLLIELIPEIKPKITKAELTEHIKMKYPDEVINVTDSHIQWRLYQFWFENGLISSVQVGS